MSTAGTPTWNQVTFEGPMPAERYSHTATMIGEKVSIHLYYIIIFIASSNASHTRCICLVA